MNGQYNFVSHDKVAMEVHPYLVKYGIVVITTIEEMKQNHNRTEVNLVSTFVNADTPTDIFSVRTFGYGIDNGDKGPGKAFSYAYKYALLKVLCLQTGEDPDNDANSFYQPAKCIEFDSIFPKEMSTADKHKLKKFLAHSSQSLRQHVEDVKREAVKRPEDFLRSFASFQDNSD